ncbi:uncharacterized protein MYCFIDRAFT_199696 [Pseudocercospora fijiensis CIRAD86]|uniref:Uncharacterized protein n=1 Tax=Pseudocercospora fijiensis (strain CIRAD86) TaxID=383855 RepID=M2YL85_PSEFD|nr:uncharacterized protein MYCFIDRAFT_199696 [Pseudocercospora fijiensis CIRAD86]EME78500.1 hypothetical protein MYCFIDRAFT_199696 [Pseudocercospora fijiensis CIRAD86]
MATKASTRNQPSTTMQGKNFAACHQVINTVELLEAILVASDDLRALFLGQRVNRAFKGTIDGSQKRQKKLWLLNDPDWNMDADEHGHHGYEMNPLLLMCSPNRCDDEHPTTMRGKGGPLYNFLGKEFQLVLMQSFLLLYLRYRLAYLAYPDSIPMLLAFAALTITSCSRLRAATLSPAAPRSSYSHCAGSAERMHTVSERDSPKNQLVEEAAWLALIMTIPLGSVNVLGDVSVCLLIYIACILDIVDVCYVPTVSVT